MVAGHTLMAVLLGFGAMAAKAGMGAWLDKLENVTFERTLGTQGARIARIEALARDIAPLVGADADLASQAAKVAKADLSSEMVYEFPELPGLMGRYYIEAAGRDAAVAAAAEDLARLPCARSPLAAADPGSQEHSP